MKTRNVNGVADMLKQVHLALFDLAIHTPTNHAASKEMDISKMWNAMRDETVGLVSCQDGAGSDWGWGQAGFPHIFRKYDAGYFAYPL